MTKGGGGTTKFMRCSLCSCYKCYCYTYICVSAEETSEKDVQQQLQPPITVQICRQQLRSTRMLSTIFSNQTKCNKQRYQQLPAIIEASNRPPFGQCRRSRRDLWRWVESKLLAVPSASTSSTSCCLRQCRARPPVVRCCYIKFFVLTFANQISILAKFTNDANIKIHVRTTSCCKGGEKTEKLN